MRDRETYTIELTKIEFEKIIQSLRSLDPTPAGDKDTFALALADELEKVTTPPKVIQNF